MKTKTTKQLKQEFNFTLSRFSHEIRNPIALISSELQLMASSHPELCSYRHWDDLMDNLDYLTELLNELSDFNHAATVRPVPVNPKEFLASALSCEKSALNYLGITLETHMENINSQIYLDRIKMRQVILNLIRNACEAIDHPGGKISVDLRKTDSGICFSIRDNGCGMTKEQISEIFQPFITYKPEGTGLGLAITSEIITAHHGQIKVHSRPGQGTVFSVYLPDTAFSD